jgi:hypothetical protein
VGVLLAVLLLGGGGLLWSWANQPSICHDASVTSERFGYCITAPEGWRVAEAGDDLPADQLFRPEGATTLMIQAVDTRRDLRAFAGDVRGLQTDNGLNVERIRTLTVAGVDALRWTPRSLRGHHGEDGRVRARRHRLAAPVADVTGRVQRERRRSGSHARVVAVPLT